MASTDPAKTGDQEVFGSLPDRRTTRRSSKRASASPAAPAKTKAATKPKATGKTKPKPKAAAKPKPKAAAKPKPKAAAKPKAKPAAPPLSTVPPAGYATPRQAEESAGRGDLLGTAVQAAGEITQIAAAAGSRAVRSALKRLPRP